MEKGGIRDALARALSRSRGVRALTFHRLGRLRDHAADLRQRRASGRGLVTAAIASCSSV